MSNKITCEQFLSYILARKDNNVKLDLTEFLESFDFMCAMSETEDPYVNAAKKRYAKCNKYLKNKSQSKDIQFILTCLILTNYKHEWLETDYRYAYVEENSTKYDALPHKTIETIIEEGPIELLDACRIELYNRMLLVYGSDNKRVPYEDYPDNHKIIAMLAVTNHVLQFNCSPDEVSDAELCYISSVVNPCILIFCDSKSKHITVRKLHGKKFDTKGCRAVTQQYPYTKHGLIRLILDIIANHNTNNEYNDQELKRYADCL